MSGPNLNEYNKIVPQPNDFLADSQDDFLTNFGQLYNAFARNHVALDAASLSGNHTKIELLQQSQGPETSVGEISLYSKKLVQPKQTTIQLYHRYQGGAAAGTEVQLTNYQLYSPGALEQGLVSFFTFLPGGLILYFGIINFSKAPANSLYLQPYICTNIMAYNFCVKGTKLFADPTVVFINTERPPIVTRFQAQPAFNIPFEPKFPNVDYYFIVLGNTT